VTVDRGNKFIGQGLDNTEEQEGQGFNGDINEVIEFIVLDSLRGDYILGSMP
jgi:hypothetical protein